MSDKYAFIDAEYAAACAPSIERMCRWLQVSKSADAPGRKLVGDITYSAQPAVMCSSAGCVRDGPGRPRIRRRAGLW